MPHGQDVDCERIEDAVRNLLLELQYEPDEPPSQVVACCQAAARELEQWRGDWNSPPRAFRRLAEGRWPGLRPSNADEPTAFGDVDVAQLSPFLQRRVETESDVRARVAWASEHVDSPNVPYERLAEAAIDALETDR